MSKFEDPFHKEWRLDDAYIREKFTDHREPRNLKDFKDMTVDELLKEKEKIEKEIFKRLGS